MKKESLNTKLYEKIFAEQEEYRCWLLEQPPSEILNHAYEYVMREDILLSLEYNDLSIEQVKALLKSPAVLTDVFKDWEKREVGHMEDIRETIENSANTFLRQEHTRLKHTER